MKKSLIICIVLCVSTSILYAQNRIIKGRVVDDNLETLPDVSIIVNDTIKVGRTDLNGFFQIDFPFSINKISFESVGSDPVTVRLVDKCDEVEVVMMLSGTYDFVTPNRVDRLRMKNFKKLTKLHREAFAKGIFKTAKACYSQEFVSYYKKTQKL